MVNAFDVWMSERLSWDEKALANWRRAIDTPPPAARRSPEAAERAGESFLSFMRDVTGQEGVSTG